MPRFSVSYTMTATEDGWREVEAKSAEEAMDKVERTLLDNPGDFMPTEEAKVEITDVRRMNP